LIFPESHPKVYPLRHLSPGKPGEKPFLIVFEYKFYLAAAIVRFDDCRVYAALSGLLFTKYNGPRYGAVRTMASVL
jgi:hypothetical protein